MVTLTVTVDPLLIVLRILRLPGLIVIMSSLILEETVQFSIVDKDFIPKHYVAFVK